MVPCRPVHKHTLWPTQAGRGTHVVCQSVCETGKWKLWELSFLIALLTWVSAPLRETKPRLHRKPISQSNYHHLQWWRRISFVRHSQIYDRWQTRCKLFVETGLVPLRNGYPCKWDIWSAWLCFCGSRQNVSESTREALSSSKKKETLQKCVKQYIKALWCYV